MSQIIPNTTSLDDAENSKLHQKIGMTEGSSPRYVHVANHSEHHFAGRCAIRNCSNYLIFLKCTYASKMSLIRSYAVSTSGPPRPRKSSGIKPLYMPPRPSFLLTLMKQSMADLYRRSSAGLSESSIIRRRIVSKG